MLENRTTLIYTGCFDCSKLLSTLSQNVGLTLPAQFPLFSSIFALEVSPIFYANSGGWVVATREGGKHCEEKYVHFKDPFFMAATFVSHFLLFFSESAYCLMSSLPPPANS